MKSMLQNRPFHTRYEVFAKIEAGGNQLDNLHTLVNLPENEPGEIEASVVGPGDLVYRIQELTKEYYGYLIFSGQLADYRSRLYSKSSRVSSVMYQTAELNDSTQERFTISFGDLTVQEPIFLNKPRTREIVYLLNGPRAAWPVDFYRFPDFYGNATVELSDHIIDIDGQPQFTISVEPRYFHELTYHRDRPEMNVEVLAICFSTLQDYDSYAHSDFLEASSFLADNILLLISFISRRWIKWYSRYCYGKDFVEKRYRRIKPCSNEVLGQSQILIRSKDVYGFLKLALRRMKELCEDGCDVTDSIKLFITAMELETPNEAFPILFLALEKIKVLYAKGGTIDKVMPRETFDRLRNKLADVINNEGYPSEILSELNHKLGNLNGKTIQTVVESLLDDKMIKWADLYPASSKLSIFKTRHALLHGSMNYDSDLMIETVRLQVIVERMILNLLGWNWEVSCLSRASSKFFESSFRYME